MMIKLKKLKQDFALVFRFFGQDESEIEEFAFEYNSFCDSIHPRFNGEFGYNKVKFEGEIDQTDYKIDVQSQKYMAVSYRGEKEEDEKTFFETMQLPRYEEIEEMREAIEEYYTDANNQGSIQPAIGYKEAYTSLMDKLSKNFSFCILDDYSYFNNKGFKHGKLLLIDPYDINTLQIFFDTDLDKYPEKIDVIDVVTGKQLSPDYYLNKNVVNVDPYKAIVDINYFNNKIEECLNNRKSELLKIQAKQIPIIPNSQDLNFEEEMKKLPGDIYLQMTVLPLLQNALNMCDMVRPLDPVSYIATFMLIHKDTARKIEDIIKELPKKKENDEITTEILVPEEEIVEEEPPAEPEPPKEEEKKVEEVKVEKPKEEEKKMTETKLSKKSKNTTKTSINAKKA